MLVVKAVEPPIQEDTLVLLVEVVVLVAQLVAPLAAEARPEMRPQLRAAALRVL